MNLIIFYTIDGVLYMHEVAGIAAAREWVAKELADAEDCHLEWRMISIVAERAHA
jgi:hypothetical protein